MTVSYTSNVGTATTFGAFGKVLLIWQGSVYKLAMPGLLIYLLIYFAISAIYRNLLNPEQRTQFEQASMFCEKHSNLIPLSFVLAFYVGSVVSRWWDQWNKLAWPDNVAFKVNSYCRGVDEQARLIRRNVVRYTVLAITMTFRYVSSKVYKRFPTLDHLVDAGLQFVHWIPLSWASSLVINAYEQGYIKDEGFVREIENEILQIKSNLGATLGYDWINLPIVYTQVVSLAVYSYFGFALMGRQWLDPNKTIDGYDLKVDYYFPVFTALQFFFYVGWLKVAEALMNPYGEDDDDFDMNWMIDRHVQVSYMMIDEVGQFPPQPTRDMYWDMGIPSELPYTVASLPFRGSVPSSAALAINVPLEEQQAVYASEWNDKPQSPLRDGVHNLYEQVSNFFVSPSSNSLFNSDLPAVSQAARRSFSVSGNKVRHRQYSIAVMNESHRPCRTSSESSDTKIEKKDRIRSKLDFFVGGGTSRSRKDSDQFSVGSEESAVKEAPNESAPTIGSDFFASAAAGRQNKASNLDTVDEDNEIDLASGAQSNAH